MKIQVWVVRDSDCGNGDDDPGEILGIYNSPEGAEKARDDFQAEFTGVANYEVCTEGPFDLEFGLNDIKPPLCVGNWKDGEWSPIIPGAAVLHEGKHFKFDHLKPTELYGQYVMLILPWNVTSYSSEPTNPEFTKQA